MNLKQLTTLQRSRLAIFLFYIIQGICFASWASRIPTIKGKLGISDGHWGTVLLMLAVGEVCGMMLSGWIISKYGSRKILPLALLGHVIAFACLGLSNTTFALCCSLVGFGFSANFYNISLNTQGINIEREYGKSIMATFHGGWSIAGAIASGIGMFMIAVNIQPAVHFLFIIVIVGIIYFTNKKYLLPDKKIVKPEEKKTSNNKPEGFLFLLGIIAFFGMAAEGSMHDWSGLYYEQVIKTPKALVLIGFFAYMITMSTTRFGVDHLTRRFGKKMILQLSGLCIFIGLMLAVLFPHIISATIGFMIVALGTASIAPTAYSAAGQNTKIASSYALMIVSSVGFLGYLIGPPLIGYVSHLTNLRYSYAIISLFGLGIIFVAQRVKVLRK